MYLCGTEIEKKIVEGFGMYDILSSGEVFSHYRKRIMNQQDNNGYKQVCLCNSDRQQWHYIHRLVAQHFIDNPDNKPWVNHKDGNKANNDKGNLEWSTVKENIQHSIIAGLRVMPKGINHKMFGKHHNESTKKLMSEAKTGINHPKYKGSYVIEGVIYHSALLAGQTLNIDPKQVKKRANSPDYPNYTFIPKEKIKNQTHFLKASLLLV